MNFLNRERNKVDRALKRAGFGGLDDPTLFDQIAFVINRFGPVAGHSKFRSMLLSVEPTKRQIAYQSIAPKLNFKALSLEDYIAFGQQEAERKQLPLLMPDGTLKEWTPQEIKTEEYKRAQQEKSSVNQDSTAANGDSATKTLEDRAVDAIAQDFREDNAKYQLTLVCSWCTFTKTWRASSKGSCLKLANQERWLIHDKQFTIYTSPQVTTLCPGCRRARQA